MYINGMHLAVRNVQRRATCAHYTQKTTPIFACNLPYFIINPSILFGTKEWDTKRACNMPRCIVFFWTNPPLPIHKTWPPAGSVQIVSEWPAEIDVGGVVEGWRGVEWVASGNSRMYCFHGENVTALISTHFYLFHFVIHHRFCARNWALVPISETTILLYNSMKPSHSWEAASFSSTQKFCNILWNPKVHCRVHKSSQMFPIFSKINPVRTFPSHLIF
jgi:hypothetical protein